MNGKSHPATFEIFNAFVAAINAGSPEALAALMSPGHLFVDSVGNRAQGREPMETGWRGYFAMCPDYWIRVDEAMEDRGTILAAGEAGGTIDGAPWRTPAAWKAVIGDGAVTEWRVYADNKPVYEILARRKA
jgi:ketosteroid isomerase-like protein